SSDHLSVTVSSAHADRELDQFDRTSPLNNFAKKIGIAVSVGIPTVWIIEARADFRHGSQHGVAQPDRISHFGEKDTTVTLTGLLKRCHLRGDQRKPRFHCQVNGSRGRGTAIRDDNDVGSFEQISYVIFRQKSQDNLMIVRTRISNNLQ